MDFYVIGYDKLQNNLKIKNLFWLHFSKILGMWELYFKL